MSRCGAHLHRDTESFESLDKTSSDLGFTPAVEVVGAEFGIRSAGGEDVVRGGEHRRRGTVAIASRRAKRVSAAADRWRLNLLAKGFKEIA